MCLRHLPLAKDLVRLARQQLVHRLDSYMSRKNEPVFRRVLTLVDKQVSGGFKALIGTHCLFTLGQKDAAHLGGAKAG
jgi:hypothetical protein